MNFLFPFLAAVLQATSLTIDKMVLSFPRVSFKTYSGVSFPLIFLVNLILFFIFRPPFSAALFSGELLWLLLASIALTVVTNLLFYRALDSDDLGEIQLVDLLHNIPILIVSSLVFTDERNLAILIPALVASLAVFWSHWERHHFRVARSTAPFLIWSVAVAPVAALISKVLLSSWSPIALEMVRSGGMVVLLGPFFSKYIDRVSPQPVRYLLLTNVFTAIAWILFFFSYQRLGVVHTILIFSIQPLLVYAASLLFLHESFHWKKATAFAIVLGSIIVAQVLA